MIDYRSIEQRVSQALGLTRQEIFGLFRLKCRSGPLDLAA